MMRLRRRMYYGLIIVSIVGFILVILNVYQSKTEYQIETDSTANLDEHIKDSPRSQERLTNTRNEHEQDQVVAHKVNNSADNGNQDQDVAITSDIEDSKEYLENVNVSVQSRTANDNFEEVQEDRKSHLNATCDRLGITRSLPPVSWASTVHFIISDKFKFLFCFVPKIACTMWKDIMIEVYHNQVGETNKRFVKLNEITKPPEVLRRWRTYRKVLFVREPFTRALSAYLNKFRYGDEKRAWERRFGAQIAKQTRTSANIKGLYKDFTFEEFIRFILYRGPDVEMDQMKDHWLPYSSFTSPCRVQYDFIGHYETLAQDGPAIIKKLGIADVVHFPEIHGSASVESLQKEYAQVPVDLILKLQEYYKLDYELFGYSKEESLKLVLSGRNTTVRIR